MPSNFMNLVQSSWTKGMQSKILSARNDTDILSKGSAILDNVIIMQQGGLQKRPCAKKTNTAIPSGYSFIGIVSFNGNDWILSYDNEFEVAFSKLNSNITTRVNINRPYMVFYPHNISFIQNGNTILFLPFWTNITYVDDNTFNKNMFIFNSYPTSPTKKNSIFFNNYDSQQSVRVHFFGTGDAASLAQARNQNAYISVGSKILIYTNRDSPMQPLPLIGSIWSINGLYIKILSNTDTANGTYLVGVVMYGSSNVLPTEKVAQSFLDGWTDVYTLSSLAEDVVFLSQDFGNYAGGGIVFPEIVTNYQNRLITAIVRENPASSELRIIYKNDTKLWCSAAGNNFSYLQTSRDDDSPFSVSISGDISPKILNIVAGDFLYIFTNVGVYAFVNSTNSTFTTNNINLKKIGNHRCNSVKPIQHDNQLFYVQENGRAILSITADNNGNSLDIDRTILCPTFIRNVSHLCSSNYIRNNDENSVSDNSSYLFALSDEIDQKTGIPTGRRCILSYQFMSHQGLDGWTRWVFEDNKYPTDIFTYQDRLFAKFINDNNIYEFVMGIHTDDLPTPSVPKILIKTNPFALRDPINGDLLFKRKKYSRMFIYYVDTKVIKVNGEEYNVGALLDGTDPSSKTNILEITQFNEYKILNDIEISHQDNSDFKMIALQVGLEVEVGR